MDGDNSIAEMEEKVEKHREDEDKEEEEEVLDQWSTGVWEAKDADGRGWENRVCGGGGTDEHKDKNRSGVTRKKQDVRTGSVEINFNLNFLSLSPNGQGQNILQRTDEQHMQSRCTQFNYPTTSQFSWGSISLLHTGAKNTTAGNNHPESPLKLNTSSTPKVLLVLFNLLWDDM